MNSRLDDSLSKSRTTYRDLHQVLSPSISPARIPFESQPSLTDDSDDDDQDDGPVDMVGNGNNNTLPTFVNRFFFPDKPINSNESGMFRAIRGQVIIHHDDDRSSKVQHEDENEVAEEEDEEIESLPIQRTNAGNYELHYDVDNPLEISCSMSLSSAETVSDRSPSPHRLTSLININGSKSTIQRSQTPLEPSEEDGDDDTPSSVLTDSDHHESNGVLDRQTMKEQDEKLRTFRGWHLSMLKQIDEKLREIEHETSAPPTTATAQVNNPPEKTFINAAKNPTHKKKLARPTIRRRFEPNNLKRQSSPRPTSQSNTYRSRTPSVEKESRTLVINLPPSSSSSSSSDNEQDQSPALPPPPVKPIHIRIIQHPVRPRSQSTDRLLLRDQSAQTESSNTARISPRPIEQRPVRPASVECDRVQPTRSLTRTQGAQFLQQEAQHGAEPIKFYSLRSRNVPSRPSIVSQAPVSVTRLPPTPPTPSMPIESLRQPFPPVASADPLVYSDDYGHVTKMDTTNLGTLVDRVFDDIYQDKPSDFYRDYRQLLNDIQVRFSMMTATEPAPPPPPPPAMLHRRPPPLPPMHRPAPPAQVPQTYVDYSRLSQSVASSQARLCDTLIYIPHSR